jgi:hypothetical protein
VVEVVEEDGWLGLVVAGVEGGAKWESSIVTAGILVRFSVVLLK